MRSRTEDGSRTLQLDPGVTRRDFVGATLVGAGAGLLGAPSPAAAQTLSPGWSGYGGVGDYRLSNGDTLEVTEAAHRIRDRRYSGALADVVETGEDYDLVIVGAGFSGLAALHEFKARHPHGKALLLDNQEIFGGYAKSNDFDVDGYRVSGAQATMNFLNPQSPEERASSYFDALGLPDRFRFAEREDGVKSFKFQTSSSGALYFGEQCATVGYHFQNASAAGQGRWVKDIWSDELRRAALPASYRQGLLTLRDRKRRGKPNESEAAWLDSMSFEDFATRELRVSPEALSYVTLGMCITGPKISAFGAQSMPGTERFAEGSPGAQFGERFISFPGGNTTLLRYFVKSIFPGAIAGPHSLEAIASAPVDLSVLDRPGAACRMRLRATAVRVKHEGEPDSADHVELVYEKGGRLYRVRSKAAVLGIGCWVSKHIIADLPADHRAAMDQFLYSPILMINVALRNWRFLDRLGFSTARWFDGFGFYCSIRRPMLIGGRPAPFHPDKPIVMTFYVPIQNPRLPLEAQGPAGRAQLYAMPYAQYERQLIDQMQRMFAVGGFDARRDIAGIALNRWGHAFVSPPPGFFYGRGGGAAPLKVATAPFGRIAFGQSGLESWLGAAQAGKRAVGQLASVL